MPEPYRIQRLKGQLAVVWRDSAGVRHRYRLGCTNPARAAALAATVYAKVTQRNDTSVKALWTAYVAAKAGRASVVTMQETSWKALEARFALRDGASVTVADCRAHIGQRRAAGIREWTIHTELSHLRRVLNWAVKTGLIPPSQTPRVELPPEPRTEKRRLTRDEVKQLIAAADLPHVKLYIILLYSTAARTAALLELTWSRVNFTTGKIDLNNPDLRRPHKGRAVVEMTAMARAALLDARALALSPYVIEWAGKPVKKVRRALKGVARRAGVGHVNPHMLRHSAATHLAEAGASMGEIQQFLGHSDPAVTQRVYALFSPKHLQGVAQKLDFGADDGA